MSCHKLKRTKGRSNSSKLHQREVMLIRRLWFEGWTDHNIWKEYRIPFPVIHKAKDKIERQAAEEFENKEMHAVELVRFKHRLKIVIDCMDSMTNDRTISTADRINAERIKLDALAMLQDATQASISSPDPQTALKKIVEQSNSRRL
jgi:hypothetical protein